MLRLGLPLVLALGAPLHVPNHKKAVRPRLLQRLLLPVAKPLALQAVRPVPLPLGSEPRPVVRKVRLNKLRAMVVVRLVVWVATVTKPVTWLPAKKA